MSVHPTAFAHETAIVEDGASIGADTKVWHHGHIRSGATIGERCVLGKNVFVDSGGIVGSGVKIQNNVSVYSGITIEDDVFVGPSAVFTNDLFPRAANPSWSITETLVRHGASIGANATIKCGSTIGRFAMIGAGSVVTHDVADHQLVVGNPARPAGWVGECGHVVSRSADTPASFDCAECREG
ncbi:MAG: acyltransferase [Microthrixaceae bacterium]|jgi:acetyltransferase-like isoleucine patch superfamily enzyme